MSKSPPTSSTESAYIFQGIVEHIPALIWLADATSNLVYLNQNWLDFTGSSLASQLASGWVTSLHPDDAHDCLGLYQTNFKNRTGFKMQYRLRWRPDPEAPTGTTGAVADETYRWVMQIATPRTDKTGTFLGFQGFCTDIHETKSLEIQNSLLAKELETSQQFVQVILDSIPDPVFVKDSSHLWIFGNDAFSALMGKTRAEYLGKSDFDAFPHDMATVFRETDEMVMNSGLPNENEEQLLNSTGDIRTILTKKVPTRLATGEHILVGVIRDITELRRKELSLLQSAKWSSLGEMAGGIAHEINNPLAIITLKASQMKDSLETGNLDTARFQLDLTKIQNTVDRIAKIIRGLRAFSRNAEQDPLVPTPLSQVVAETLELCRERFRVNGVELRIDNRIDTKIACRPAQISQILMNLLSNAIDATEKLELKWVELSVARNGAHITVSVTDSGYGIDASIIEKMMNPFFTTKEVGKGTGLGLSISKGIAEDHGGALKYDAHSANTRFILELPVKA